MKFLHLGDLHLGKSLGDYDLYEDQTYIMHQILEIATEKEVDGLLLAGDIYDKSVPSEKSVRIFDEFLQETVRRKLKVFMISGNHDSQERLHFGSSLFTANDIYISAKYQGELCCYTLEDDYGRLNIYLLPYIRKSLVENLFPEETVTTYEDAVNLVLQKAAIDPNQRNLLVAHQFVVGKKGQEEPELSGSESLSTKAASTSVGTIEKIDASCFDGFDYVALGHIHSAQKVGREQIRYAGSPLKYSLSEVHHHKSVPLVTIHEKNNVKIELIDLHPLRDVRHITGTMDKLLQKENIINPDDYIAVTLTDEEQINDVRSIFQQYYPNLLKITYDNSYIREITEVNPLDFSKQRSFQELFEQFYQQMYGCEISEEEWDIIKKIAGEVGVLDETD